MRPWGSLWVMNHPMPGASPMLTGLKAISIDEPVSAGGDLPGGFAVGAAVAKEIPARPGGADVHGALAFVVAVIPLGEVGLDLRGLAQTEEYTGAAGALQWAGQHMIKADAAEMRGP